MSPDLAGTIITDFVKNSWTCVETIVKRLAQFKSAEKPKTRLFRFRDKRGDESTVDNGHFFLRASVEYSNPQVTLEEIQGIIAARLLEVCGNHFHDYGLHGIDQKDIEEIREMLNKPPKGISISFLLNTDDVEPDRYSANPLRKSIVDSGQSAFPSATVKTSELKIDHDFVHKYEGILISKGEVEMIDRNLETSNNSYADMIDAIKYEQLENLSETFGINLCIYSMRMPLAILEKERQDGILHHIISETHKDYDSIERAYNCMGRSMKSRTTLLTVPHSGKGYGSKRAARGKIRFDGRKLKEVHVDYRTTSLYENEIDPKDISLAKADDSFTVEGEKLVDYDFRDTPSSPQFFLYSLGSPENAAIWHGIGVFGPLQLLKSYAAVRRASGKDSLMSDLIEKYGVASGVPLIYSLVPSNMWVHPTHRNIDASVGCIANLDDLASMGMRLEYLSNV